MAITVFLACSSAIPAITVILNRAVASQAHVVNRLVQQTAQLLGKGILSGDAGPIDLRIADTNYGEVP